MSEVATLPASKTKQKSHDGVGLIGGWTDLEPNVRLSPQEWFGSWGRPGVLDEMVRTDPMIGVGIEGLTHPLKAVPRSFEPATDSAAHKAHAAFLDQAVARLPGGGASWLLDQAARHAWGGIALLETFFEHDPEFEIVVDGQVQTRSVLLPRFAPIMPWAIARWRPDGGIIQSPPMGEAGAVAHDVELGPGEFVHLKHAPQGDDPHPPGRLRACYPAYLMRRKIRGWMSVGFERSSLGVPKIKEAKDAKLTDSERRKIREVVAAMRTGARSFVYFPYGVDLDFAEFPFKAKELLEAYDFFGTEILQRLFMQSVKGGISGIGSYASISGHHALAVQVVRAIDHNIVTCLAPVWDATIRANFSDHGGVFPRWVHPEITIMPELDTWAAAMVSLSDAGALQLTDGDEPLVRSRLQLGAGSGPARTPSKAPGK